MPLIAEIDTGNATTEAALAQDGRFTASGTIATAGMKGTRENIAGVIASLQQALDKTPWSLQDMTKICIGEATPVTGDVAVETVTKTVVAESTMIGHNPQTPGGVGVGIGATIAVEKLAVLSKDRFARGWIPLVGEGMDFLKTVWSIDEALDRGVSVVAAILKKDDDVLMSSRLHRPIPVVDEVTLLEKMPEGMLATVEVAIPGQVMRVLSNPYGIATFFVLTPKETQTIVPITRTLIGNRSIMVLKTPQGDVRSKIIPAGKIVIRGERRSSEADVAQSAQVTMQTVSACAPARDIRGGAGTHVDGMLERVRKVMALPTNHDINTVHIQDLLAVDTFVPCKVQDSVTGECSVKNAVGIAAIVKADHLQMQAVASGLGARLDMPVEVGGVEANMAVAGVLTTLGCATPLVILDLGAGSTDATVINNDSVAKAVYLAGAGNMVSLLIQTELGLSDVFLVEEIKKYPLAKVKSLFSIRHENGLVESSRELLNPSIFAKVVYLKEGELIPIDNQTSLGKIRLMRRQAKEKVFVTNCLRALRQVSPGGSVRDITFVVLVGGSSLDFEIPQMITDALAHYGAIAGQGNTRGAEGPHNAVATGLVLAGEAKKQRRKQPRKHLATG